MLDLPVVLSPLRVALVYNQKKEDATQQSMTEDGSDPPSTSGSDLPTLLLPTHPSTLLVNDCYAEWDTWETISAVRDALAQVHSVSLIEADEFVFEKLQADRPDIVFNMAEGLNGVSREAQVPAILEMLNIPYTGSDPLTLAICLDKSRAKEIMAYHGIPTPSFSVVHNKSEIEALKTSFPAIVKPLHEGSSKGIFNTSLVQTRAELRTEVQKILEIYDEPALVEEYLSGREFTVAMLGNGDQTHVLPIIEIKFDSLPYGVNPIYSFEAKWIWDRSDKPLDIFACPARISAELRRDIESICLQAYRLLRCRDWCRIDVRLDAMGSPQILELNPLPGILPNPEDNSCFPKAARAAGMSYTTLLQSVLALAAERSHVMNGRSTHRPTN